MSSTPEDQSIEKAQEEQSEEKPARFQELHVAMIDALQRELGDGLVEHFSDGSDIWVRVRPDSWLQAAQVCKEKIGCDYFCFLSGIDWRDDTDLSGENAYQSVAPADPSDAIDESEDAEEQYEQLDAPVSSAGEEVQPRVAGGETRFQVLARLYSTRRKAGITLKADLDDEAPRVQSWVTAYAGADWHERETWEMYGFDFEGHPGLRHMYLPGEFEGTPLRKDFPLLAREVKPWPGLVDLEPMPDEVEADSEEATAE